MNKPTAAYQQKPNAIIWRRIVGFPRYRISDRGEVLDTHKNRKLKPAVDGHGYLKVALMKDGKQHFKYVHRLVAEASIPNPNNLDTVDHIDSDKMHNRVSNLQWLTLADNTMKAHEERGHNANKWFSGYYDGEFVGRWQNQTEAARELKLNRGTISACLRGSIPHTGGFTFRYDE